MKKMVCTLSGLIADSPVGRLRRNPGRKCALCGHAYGAPDQCAAARLLPWKCRGGKSDFGGAEPLSAAVSRCGRWS